MSRIVTRGLKNCRLAIRHQPQLVGPSHSIIYREKSPVAPQAFPQVACRETARPRTGMSRQKPLFSCAGSYQ